MLLTSAPWRRTGAGWVLALALVRTLGPSAQLEPGAPLAALGYAAVAAAAGLLTIGLLGARAVPSDRAATSARTGCGARGRSRAGCRRPATLRCAGSPDRPRWRWAR